MLLSKPLETVTWDDVQAFCALQLAESAVLDYKQDFPAHLESTIAAIANTMGGTIIIGVAENAEGRPQAPV
jgi:predicted HTH transcriptional regulator